MTNSNVVKLSYRNNSFAFGELQNFLAQGKHDAAAAFIIETAHQTANNSISFRTALTADKPMMGRILSLDHPGLTTALLTVTAQEISAKRRLPGARDEAANAAAIEFLKKLLLKAAPQKDAESKLQMTILMENLAAIRTRRAEGFVADAAFMENMAFHSQSPLCANALWHIIDAAISRAESDAAQLSRIGAGIHAGLRGAARQDFVANGMAESLLSTVVRYPDSALRRDIISDPALAPLFGNRFLTTELFNLTIQTLAETGKSDFPVSPAALQNLTAVAANLSPRQEGVLRQEIAEKIEDYHSRKPIWIALNAARELCKPAGHEAKPDGFLARARSIFTPRFKKPRDPA